MAANLLLSVAYGISDYFTGEGITYAVLAHIDYGIRHGELGIARFPAVIAIITSILGAFTLWLWAIARLQRRRPGRRQGFASWALLVLSFAMLWFHPAATDFRRMNWRGVAHPSLGLDMRWKVDPSLKRKPRSVVYVYAESFERTFLDDGRFPGLAPRINQLEQEGLSFRGIANAPLMNWTISGMIASQCGMVMSTIPAQRLGDTYQPGAHCLADLMRDSGYQLSYIGGADPAFAGKGRFYKSQGFGTVIGVDELRAEFGEIPVSIWGAHDDIVFRRAQIEFEALNASDKPFALIVLTNSTHPPSGFPSPYCTQGIFAHRMLDAIHCSDTEVYDFVRWVQRQNSEELLIVVASDHIQVAGDAAQLLGPPSTRENLFFVLGQDIKPGIINRTATMVDVAPTLGYLLGFGLTEMALGRNLVLQSPTLAEQHGQDTFNSMIPAWRVGLSHERD